MKIILPITMLLAAALVAPALYLGSLLQHQEIERAAERHAVARRGLEDVTSRVRETEVMLLRVTTSPMAVEDEVLARMRMVRPGETLVLIEQTPGP